MGAVKPAATRRILFFADASSVHTRRWVQAMVERSFECFVATRLPAEIPGAADVIPLKPGSGGAGWFGAIPQVRTLARQLRPHWIHGHYVTSYGLWAAACDYPVPKLLTAWGSDILVTPREKGLRGSFMAGLVGWSLRQAQLITADSADVIEAIKGYGPSAPCHEILWGADTDRFRPSKAPRTGFELLSLRNWEPNYNIDLILRALAALRAVRPQADATLSLLGGGPDEGALRALAKQLGIEGAVRFTGRVDDVAMVAALQRATVSISVPSSDATSVAMLESMACGAPVVASDLPANRAWIDDSLRVPAGDADALCATLLRLHDDPALARVQGERNRQAVLQRGSRKAQMDRMAILYESLWLKAPPAPPAR
ncbi:glycosyltransferase [Rivibacter subsaxonicus]|uniref:Glycosyltransferase involved in cell wall biosynthesis n=1 Tax=Rivibacter subsaxonicus TaxID=457575 RepID=A0A4Q7VGQ9_9BURK|nr:glycosyltransferase [Rivibacter subsaxonicus]RZT95230.1 glycosyltransferase involved in cell wall biosynthesis [Rivibacter subsaxonicus]